MHKTEYIERAPDPLYHSLLHRECMHNEGINYSLEYCDLDISEKASLPTLETKALESKVPIYE